MNDQFYLKKNGEYVAVNDPFGLDGLTNGSWLVVVEKGHTSCKNFIKPKFAELDAALHYLNEGLCKAMSEASKMRPQNIKMSKKEQKAWKAYRKIMGKDMPRYFHFASTCEIADKGCEYLKKIIYENKYDIGKIKEKYEMKKVINPILDLEV